MYIDDNCINCSACAVECPMETILPPGVQIQIGAGTSAAPISDEHFFIVPEECNECAGFSTMKCVAVCPMDAIRSDK